MKQHLTQANVNMIKHGGDKITDFFYKDSEIKTLPVFANEGAGMTIPRSKESKILNQLFYNGASYEKSVMTCVESDYVCGFFMLEFRSMTDKIP